MRILVVDDHPDTADALRLALEVMGHQCQTALSEAQAVEVLARSLGFDAYVIDMDLRPGPPCAGALLLEKLRNAGSEAPAALVTAHAEEMVEAARLRAAQGGWGRVVCLRKPFDVAELVRELEAMRHA